MELIIKQICRDKKINLITVAEKLGISRQALDARIKNNPKKNSLIEIADTLNMHIIELIQPPPGYEHIYNIDSSWAGIRKKK